MDFVDAFQTLENRNNITQVEREGPYLCNRKDAWLGIGYYLWDTNIQWAKDWGEKAYIIKRNKGYIIGECKVDLSHCFDLVGNVSHQNEFTEAINVFKQSKHSETIKNVTVPFIIEFMKRKHIFEYKLIRVQDSPKSKNKVYFKEGRSEFIFINNRVQICVLDKKEVIKSGFKVIFEKKV